MKSSSFTFTCSHVTCCKNEANHFSRLVSDGYCKTKIRSMSNKLPQQKKDT